MTVLTFTVFHTAQFVFQELGFLRQRIRNGVGVESFIEESNR